MNHALKTTFGDLARSLNKALSSSRIEQQLKETAIMAAGELVVANAKDHPGLKSKVVKQGPLAFTIEVSSPGLWASVFGSATTDEKPLITNSVRNEVNRRGSS